MISWSPFIHSVPSYIPPFVLSPPSSSWSLSLCVYLLFPCRQVVKETDYFQTIPKSLCPLPDPSPALPSIPRPFNFIPKDWRSIEHTGQKQLQLLPSFMSMHTPLSHIHQHSSWSSCPHRLVCSGEVYSSLSCSAPDASPPPWKRECCRKKDLNKRDLCSP